MTFWWRGRQRWLWGTLATWFIRLHIKHEIRVKSERIGVTRGEAMELMRQRMSVHFDAAWPVSE